MHSCSQCLPLPSCRKHAIKVGNNHGIRTDEAVAGLLELMMELGRNFELALDSAWIRETLEDEDCHRKSRSASSASVWRGKPAADLSKSLTKRDREPETWRDAPRAASPLNVR